MQGSGGRDFNDIINSISKLAAMQLARPPFSKEPLFRFCTGLQLAPVVPAWWMVCVPHLRLLNNGVEELYICLPSDGVGRWGISIYFESARGGRK